MQMVMVITYIPVCGLAAVAQMPSNQIALKVGDSGTEHLQKLAVVSFSRCSNEEHPSTLVLFSKIR